MIEERFMFPDLEFDSRNLKFTDLDDNTVISMKFFDQDGNELNIQKILNGIMYYCMMRTSAKINPEYESSIKFVKTHPSCK